MSAKPTYINMVQHKTDSNILWSYAFVHLDENESDCMYYILTKNRFAVTIVFVETMLSNTSTNGR